MNGAPLPLHSKNKLPSTIQASVRAASRSSQTPFSSRIGSLVLNRAVALRMFSLICFVLAGLPQISLANFSPFFVGSAGDPITLGEEVHEPRKTIPRDILLTPLVTMLLYIAVANVGVGVVGARALSGAYLACGRSYAGYSTAPRR